MQSHRRGERRGAGVIAADSSYFVALSDTKDRWHEDALRVRGSVPQEFFLSDFVVAEAVTIIGSRRGGKPARTMYEYFMDSCEVDFADGDLLRDGMIHHLRYDGRLSVTDCMTLAIMDRRRTRDIVSFDSDFDRVRGIRRIH